jgi:hypothetical protein
MHGMKMARNAPALIQAAENCRLIGLVRNDILILTHNACPDTTMLLDPYERLAR